MLPSSGLFTQSNCYLFEERLCKRPHCVFRHDTESQNTVTSTSQLPTVNLTETEESGDEGLQELERINLEIEKVRHQVEVEQRRLSNCQMKTTFVAINHIPEVVVKNVVKDSTFSQASPSTTYSQPTKYKVDCSKPRTDLEYDPLSNFSSDLRSYCSTSKEESKKRNEHGLKKKNENKLKIEVSQSHKLCMEHPDPNEADPLIVGLTSCPTETVETKPEADCLPKDTVSRLAVTNGSGHDEFKIYLNSASRTPSQYISTCNNFISKDNIFAKMTQDLSKCNNLNIAQPGDFQNNEQLDKSSSAAALSIRKTSANQIQKSDAPGQGLTAAYQEKRKPQQQGTVGSLCDPHDSLSTEKWTQNAFQQSTVVYQNLCRKEVDVCALNSSSDDLNYSDLEVSESDPDEECYRIFLEANGEEKSNEPVPEVVSNAKAEKDDLQPKVFSGKKRVAHDANKPEVISKARPQPRIIFPLHAPVSSTFSSQPPTPLMIHKVEHRPSILSASNTAGQTLTGESDAKHAQATSCSIPTKPVPYVGSIPLGATVIDVGNNLHLVLPEGTFPVSDSSGRVSSILTPITSVSTNSITMRQACHQSPATQQKRITQPVIIPSLARKPVSTTASSASQCSTAQASTAKPLGNKRKLKQKCEKVKVPHDIRQSYVNKFTEEFLKTTPNINEAFEKALAEERTVYNRSATKLKYLSVAVNALKRLKNQSCETLKGKHKTSLQTKGNIPLNPSLLNSGEGVFLLYECLKDYVLTDEMLIESNFPFHNPEKPGSAIIFANKKNSFDSLRKLCCRCGATYSVSQTGKHTRKEECTYHYGRGVENKVPGGVETRYSCCQGVMGSPGCQVFKLHVCNSLIMDGFVATVPKDSTDTNCPGVYSLDCEKCYTINGLELSRVTVVNSDLQIVYDSFVRPNNEVIDYNTRFSGISEEDMKVHCHSLKEVQANLLSFISADTILIGHGLETNLCVLKLLHGMVVDTSMVFPHRLGPPHKLSLHSLTAEYLRKIIQESECGHDTAEDAVACMELMLWKVKEDGKLKKAQ